MHSCSEDGQAYRRQRQSHWESIAAAGGGRRPGSAYHDMLSRLYRDIIPPGQRVLEIGCGAGELLASLEPGYGVGVDFSGKMLLQARKLYPGLIFINADAQNLAVVSGQYDYIIFSDLLDDLWDVQGFLEQITAFCSPATRIVFNSYSHLWAVPLQIAQRLGLATPQLPQNWLAPADIANLLQLGGLELLSHRPAILFPLHLPGIATLCNRYLVKLFPFNIFNLTNMYIARRLPDRSATQRAPMVSVIIPARNEAGNVDALLANLPCLGSSTEVIFVEGGSTDRTYEIIETTICRYPELHCSLYRQHGSGKGDAVRLGFEKAKGDILVILDADLSVAPDVLSKFYSALVSGRGEFINGVRLVYPMQDKAMRFFNLLANKFFSLAFSWLLGQPVKDTLCGTKALWRRDYLKIAANRKYFGDFDPFGDFDLLFGAARLHLKIVDLPVRYGERTYGTTNISRWSDGWLLLRMLVIAARRIKFV